MKTIREQQIFSCICCAIFLAASIPLFYISVTFNYPRAITKVIKPFHFPAVILGVIIVLSAAILILNAYKLWQNHLLLKKSREQQEKFQFITKNGLFTLVATILYGLSWGTLGFSISTFIFFTVVAKWLGRTRSSIEIVIVSFSYTFIVYALFVMLFRVPFPEPILSRIL